MGTKRQIYALLRALSAEGAAVLFFSSELTESPRLRPRDHALRGPGDGGAGRGRADEATLLRAMHGLGTPGAGDMSTVERRARRRSAHVAPDHVASRLDDRRAAAPRLTIPYWRSLSHQEAQFDLQALAIDVLPFALAAMAQAVVVISGGIDLSVAR